MVDPLGYFLKDISTSTTYGYMLDPCGFVVHLSVEVQGVTDITGSAKDRSVFPCLVAMIHTFILTRYGVLALRTLGRGEVDLVDGIYIPLESHQSPVTENTVFDSSGRLKICLSGQ